MRDIATEQNKVATGKSTAASSYKAQNFNLISPRVIRRLAKRLTEGGAKYGSVQYRQGINDEQYVADRFNHFFDHLLKFMEDGNSKDDNLGAMIWALHMLVDVEELSPASLRLITGMSKLYGPTATEFHEAEMVGREEKTQKAEAARQQEAVLLLNQQIQNAYPGGGLMGSNAMNVAPKPGRLSKLFTRQ